MTSTLQTLPRGWRALGCAAISAALLSACAVR